MSDCVNLVAGPGIAPGFRDYEPRVVTTPPPRADYRHETLCILQNLKEIIKN